MVLEFWGVFFLIDLHFLYWLLLHFVEREGLMLHLGEVDLGEVEEADGGVVHGSIVDAEMREVGGYRPLCGTWNIRNFHTLIDLNSCRNVEIVEDMESLLNGFLCAL